MNYLGKSHDVCVLRVHRHLALEVRDTAAEGGEAQEYYQAKAKESCQNLTFVAFEVLFDRFSTEIKISIVRTQLNVLVST